MATWQSWRVGLGILALLLLFSILPWKIKRIGKLLLPFDNPDRALAFLAFFFALQILVQQSSNYPYGLVYQFSPNDARETIAKGTTMYEWYAGYGGAVSALYWFFTACALFFLVALFRGTVRDFRHREESITKQDIKELQNGLKELSEQQHKDMLAIIERMDRRIVNLEAKNGVSKYKPKQHN
jgi:hypothetical protein